MAEDIYFFCENCGRKVPRGTERCPGCGTMFYSVRCPRCGLVASEEVFSEGCPCCGYGSAEQEPHRESLPVPVTHHPPTVVYLVGITLLVGALAALVLRFFRL